MKYGLGCMFNRVTNVRVLTRLATEKGIPIPDRLPPLIDRLQLAHLDLGDSFLVPYPINHDRRIRQCHQMMVGHLLAVAHKVLTGRRFCQRSNEHGTRVWRIV